MSFRLASALTACPTRTSSALAATRRPCPDARTRVCAQRGALFAACASQPATRRVPRRHARCAELRHALPRACPFPARHMPAPTPCPALPPKGNALEQTDLSAAIRSSLARALDAERMRKLVVELTPTADSSDAPPAEWAVSIVGDSGKHCTYIKFTCGHVNCRRGTGRCAHAADCPCVVTSDDHRADAQLFTVGKDGRPTLADRKKPCQLLVERRAAAASGGSSAEPALCAGTSYAKRLEERVFDAQAVLVRTTLALTGEKRSLQAAARTRASKASLDENDDAPLERPPQMQVRSLKKRKLDYAQHEYMSARGGCELLSFELDTNREREAHIMLPSCAESGLRVGACNGLHAPGVCASPKCVVLLASLIQEWDRGMLSLAVRDAHLASVQPAAPRPRGKQPQPPQPPQPQRPQPQGPQGPSAGEAAAACASDQTPEVNELRAEMMRLLAERDERYVRLAAEMAELSRQQNGVMQLLRATQQMPTPGVPVVGTPIATPAAPTQQQAGRRSAC